VAVVAELDDALMLIIVQMNAPCKTMMKPTTQKHFNTSPLQTGCHSIPKERPEGNVFLVGKVT
jgi:hypothetical protein